MGNTVRCQFFAGSRDAFYSGPMNWKQHTAALLIFNTVLFVWRFIILSLQPAMPLKDLLRGMLFPSTTKSNIVSPSDTIAASW